MAYLIQEDELLQATGYVQRASLERHLTDQRIWYGTGKDGKIYTTPAAFEAILKGQETNETLFDAA